MLLAKLRPDLITSNVAGDDGPMVLKDPATGRFFRFREIESFILRRLSTASDPDALCLSVEQRFGSPLPLDMLGQFLERLRSLGLLEEPGAPAVLTADRPRVRGSLLYLRLKAFDPDALLTRMLPRVRFLFSTWAAFLSGVLIVAAVYASLTRWDEILGDMPRLYNVSSLAFAYLTIFVVITAHEFAHGLTCKHFGGSVREMGFLLIYFQPAFYCNVSDAWLFPEKSKRLLVTFAGAYVEVFLWALATLVWCITDPQTSLNYAALVVMATSGIKTLFNLNPLIKLDGYYLLSDYLELPNLRDRAFAYLRSWLRAPWRRASSGVRAVPRRERRIYLMYGATAWVYSFWLIAIVLTALGGYLLRTYQGWGFAALLALTLLLFQRSVTGVLRAARSSFTLKGTMRTWMKRGLKLTVFAAVITALFVFEAQLTVSGTFVVLPAHNADVRAEVDGLIQEVAVKEGQQVRRGDLIAVLSGREIAEEIGEMVPQLAEKQARLKLLKAGTRSEEVELAKTTATKREERLRFARNRMEMQSRLFGNNLISKRDFDAAREEVAVREKEYQEARDHLDLLRAGTRQEEIDASQAEIDRLEQHQAYLKERQRLLRILSPIDGVIITQRIGEKLGQAVKTGDLVAEVHELGTVDVEISVEEKEIADVTIGQAVVLKARAYPQRSFEGEVVAIAPVATTSEDVRTPTTVRVTTRIDNGDGLLKSGLTGHAKILGDEQRLIDIASRRFVRYFRVEFWSWW